MASARSRHLPLVIAAALAVGLLTFGAASLWSSLVTDAHAFRLRLVTERQPPGAQQLQQAADVLNARLDRLSGALGLHDGAARPLPPDLVELEFSTRGDPAEPIAWLTMPGRAAFHLLHPGRGEPPADADVEPPDGYRVVTYKAKQYRLNPPRRLETVEHRHLVREEPTLRIESFRQAALHTEGLHRRTVLTLRFREEDARRFAAQTAVHVGRRMALLVDGAMFVPPKEIEEAVTGGAVQVQGYFHTPTLRKLAAVLDAGPLPGRLEDLEPRGVAQAPSSPE
ncbi:MAG: hypothetical protein R6V05_01385 [Candidatus Brocadiia bacterium]